MDFFFSLQCSSPSAERHFRFPVVVTGVTTFSAEQCPAAPEDDGPEKSRLSLSRPSGLLVMTMYLKYEVREVREKALSRSSDVDPRFRSVNLTDLIFLNFRMICAPIIYSDRVS